jgi:hypothetical protein
MLDVDTTKILASAFDIAWLALQRSSGPDVADKQIVVTRRLLAQRIIEIALCGQRDKQHIVD